MQHLMLIHLGPVQDFIASARRSRDLWFGSWLLSELSKAAAAAIQARAAANQLIFPAPGLDLTANSEVNVANRIVALVDAPKDVSKAAQDAIYNRLEALREDAFNNIKGKLRNQQVAIDQVWDLPEFYWVSTPLNESYSDARKRAEALLATRKNTRDFTQPSWGANVPKSSLDGERESVIPRDAYAQPETLYWKYGARRVEQLSGVDLLKRLGNRGNESRFPSTSHLAAQPLLRRLSKQDGIREHWKEYMKALPDQLKQQERVPPRFSYKPFNEIEDSVDGSVLFGSRLAETLEEGDLLRAQKALQDFLKKAAGGEAPIPYYALLLGDGDGMGRVIDAQKTEDAHRNLSETLASFAIEVRRIVEEHEGALVYAGGDDVLAFLPLHRALACAKVLADDFHKLMRDYRDSDGNPATFSAGIAISHHLEPLSDALELARETEKLAKTVPGKNALALAVDKRGGITRAIKGHWDDLYPQFQKYIYYQRREVDAFPGGAAYELRDAVQAMGGELVVSTNTELQKVVRQEGKRILLRKRAERGQRELPKEVVKRIKGLIEDDDLSMNELADALVIARLLARAEDQAGWPIEAPEQAKGVAQ